MVHLLHNLQHKFLLQNHHILLLDKFVLGSNFAYRWDSEGRLYNHR